MNNYKDSYEACFEPEPGNPEEDVMVEDIHNDKTFIFKWNRGKSNENIQERLFQNFSFERATLDLNGKTVPLAGFSKASFKTNRVLKEAQDTRTGKEGFSFYFARYVFYDPYFVEDEDLASNPDNTGIIGVVPGDNNEEKIIVINAEEEISGAVRIISAYYADDPKYERFVLRYNRHKKYTKKYREISQLISDADLLQIHKLVERWNNSGKEIRQLRSWELAVDRGVISNISVRNCQLFTVR